MLVYTVAIFMPALILAQVGQLSQAEEQLFRRLDRNHNNYLVLSEFENHFLRYDRNNDSVITTAEFDTGIDQESPAFRGHEAQLFNLFDEDDNKEVTLSDIATLFDAADRNNDTRVSDFEFHRILNQGIVVG